MIDHAFTGLALLFLCIRNFETNIVKKLVQSKPDWPDHLLRPCYFTISCFHLQSNFLMSGSFLTGKLMYSDIRHFERGGQWRSYTRAYPGKICVCPAKNNAESSSQRSIIIYTCTVLEQLSLFDCCCCYSDNPAKKRTES